MSESIKPTKGQAFVSRSGFATVYVDVRIGGGMLQEVAACGPTADGPDQQMANADLIAEAFNVATTHGLTPRQLVERVNELEEALTRAQQAINSMKVEAETAAQGDEQMMLEACETISNEGLDADMEIRDVLDKALPNAAAKEAGK